MELVELINLFAVPGQIVAIRPFGNGNINDTYLAICRDSWAEYHVILQRISQNVFPQPKVVMDNMAAVLRHCHAKLTADAATGKEDRVWQMPQIIPAKDGKNYVEDENGSVWRAITRIMSAQAFDTAQGLDHARECGAALGHFHYLISDLSPALLADPLPGFHVTSGYLKQYENVLETPKAKELLAQSAKAREFVQFIDARRAMALSFEKAMAAGELQKRLFHGDPKVNNIMIDEVTGKGTAMIDLDTVSPGLIHIDFGDALRSICNPAGEEVKDLSLVTFDEKLCAAFCEGYMKEAGAFLTATDRAYLYDAIRLLPFELGLRFFSDHLAGDVYFKTKEPGQNLDRAAVQFRLCELVEAQEKSIRPLFA